HWYPGFRGQPPRRVRPRARRRSVRARALAKQDGAHRGVSRPRDLHRIGPARHPLGADGPRAGATRLHHPPGGAELRPRLVADADRDVLYLRRQPDEPVRGHAPRRLVGAVPGDRLERGIRTGRARRAAHLRDEPAAAALALRREQGGAGPDGLAVLQELRDARPALARLQPHRAASRRCLLRVELRQADRRDRGWAARAGRVRGRSQAHARLLRRARHRAGLLAPARARHAGRGLQLVLRPRVVDRASPELPDRGVDRAAPRDSAGPGAPAPVRRAGPARLAAEGGERARMAHDDPLRADAHRPARVLAPADQVTPALAASGLVPGARVALVHDWLTGMRGGERCLEVLCELFPDAPLFTLLHVPVRVSPTIERRRIVPSFVQRLPRAAERYRYYLPLFPLAISRFDLAGCDLVVSMSHCVAKGVRVAPGALHLCYCFSPMRYVWDLSSDYFGPGHGLAARTLGPPLAGRPRRLRTQNQPG